MENNTQYYINIQAIDLLKESNYDLYKIALEGIKTYLGDANTSFVQKINIPGGITCSVMTNEMLQFLLSNNILQKPSEVIEELTVWQKLVGAFKSRRF
jgi:hypothetical protein